MMKTVGIILVDGQRVERTYPTKELAIKAVENSLERGNIPFARTRDEYDIEIFSFHTNGEHIFISVMEDYSLCSF